MHSLSSFFAMQIDWRYYFTKQEQRKESKRDRNAMPAPSSLRIQAEKPPYEHWPIFQDQNEKLYTMKHIFSWDSSNMRTSATYEPDDWA